MKRTIYITAILLGAGISPVLAQVPNASFENWDSLTVLNGVRIYNPVDWNSSNIAVFNYKQLQTVEMTTDAHTGNYAVKLTSTQDDQEQQATFLSSGNNIGESPDDPQAGKFPLNGRINGFEGYYKYVPNGMDSFRVFLALYRGGQYLGQSYMENGTAANEYTKFTWPVNFPATIAPPDSAKFIIEPSIFNDSEGSVLYIDDLNITYGFATGINEKAKNTEIALYPNPAKENIALLGYNPGLKYRYQIRTINGQVIQSQSLSGGLIPIHHLENGLYFLSIENENGELSQHKFIKQ